MADGKYICRKCTEEKPPGERFKVPADEFGEARMKTHLWNEHRINITMALEPESEEVILLDY